MPILKNIKLILSSLTSTFESGSNFLLESAILVENATGILAIRATIANLEAALSRGEFKTVDEEEIKKKELLKNYNELIKLSREDSIPEVIKKQKSLLLGSKKSSINRLEKHISNTKFLLPIHEIREKQKLLDEYNHLTTILDGKSTSEIEEKKKNLLDSMSFLERQRRAQKVDYYPSGAHKRSINLYDGKLDGLAQNWYENGALKAQATFKAGTLHGEFMHWRDDGKLLLKGGSSPEVSLFTRSGTEVIRLNKNQSSTTIECWLWNGIRLGRLYISSGKVRGKVFFIVRCLLSMGVLRSFYKAGNDKAEQLLYPDLLDTLKSIDSLDKIFEFKSKLCPP